MMVNKINYNRLMTFVKNLATVQSTKNNRGAEVVNT